MSLTMVSVIIPTYRDWDKLELCLDALSKQNFPSENFEIIIVNNDPEDICPYKNISEKVIILNESIRGSYAARNMGVKHAKGDIIAFTDSDCIPDGNWISNGIRKLAEGVSLGAGKIEFYFEDKDPNVFEYYDSCMKLNQEKYVQMGFGATANLFVRKTTFKVTGLFDGTLQSGGDYEYCIRAGMYGFKISYLNDAIIYHKARSTFLEILNKSKRIALGHKFLAQKNKLFHGKVSWRSFMPSFNIPSNDPFTLSRIDRLKLFLLMNIDKYYFLYYRLK